MVLMDLLQYACTAGVVGLERNNSLLSACICCCQTGVATVSEGIADGRMGLDVGDESITQFCAAIEKAQTIVWNGPVGVFEFDKFAKGSRAVLDAIVMATERGATSIIGELAGTSEQKASL